MANEVGERIARLRQLRKLTQTEVEKRANFGPSTMSKIESGNRIVSTEQAHAIARAMRVDITQIYFDDESEPTELEQALIEVRARCSVSQRRTLAHLLRVIAKEIVPVASSNGF